MVTPSHGCKNVPNSRCEDGQEPLELGVTEDLTKVGIARHTEAAFIGTRLEHRWSERLCRSQVSEVTGQ